LASSKNFKDSWKETLMGYGLINPHPKKMNSDECGHLSAFSYQQRPLAATGWLNADR
jgi:hypothetical protein